MHVFVRVCLCVCVCVRACVAMHRFIYLLMSIFIDSCIYISILWLACVVHVLLSFAVLVVVDQRRQEEDGQLRAP